MSTATKLGWYPSSESDQLASCLLFECSWPNPKALPHMHPGKYTYVCTLKATIPLIKYFVLNYSSKILAEVRGTAAAAKS